MHGEDGQHQRIDQTAVEAAEKLPQTVDEYKTGQDQQECRQYERCKIVESKKLYIK